MGGNILKLISEDYEYKENYFGLGIEFDYKGKKARAAIKVDIPPSRNQLFMLWEKLNIVINNPEKYEHKLSINGNPPLIGNEITLEEDFVVKEAPPKELNSREFLEVTKVWIDRLEREMSSASCNDLFEDEFTKSVSDKFDGDFDVIDAWKKRFVETIDSSISITDGSLIQKFKEDIDV